MIAIRLVVHSCVIYRWKLVPSNYLFHRFTQIPMRRSRTHYIGISHWIPSSFSIIWEILRKIHFIWFVAIVSACGSHRLLTHFSFTYYCRSGHGVWIYVFARSEYLHRNVDSFHCYYYARPHDNHPIHWCGLVCAQFRWKVNGWWLKRRSTSPILRSHNVSFDE